MADHRLESERIEALKLVRCFITTKEGMQHVSDGVLRAVIAIAEQADERLRNACLETLGEMSTINGFSNAVARRLYIQN